jgi:hypothetical protein
MAFEDTAIITLTDIELSELTDLPGPPGLTDTGPPGLPVTGLPVLPAMGLPVLPDTGPPDLRDNSELLDLDVNSELLDLDVNSELLSYTEMLLLYSSYDDLKRLLSSSPPLSPLVQKSLRPEDELSEDESIIESRPLKFRRFAPSEAETYVLP